MKKSTQQKVKIQSASKSSAYKTNQGNQQQNKGKFSSESLLKTRKQRKFIVKKTMKENAYLSSRKQVKHTRGEYREAQKHYRSQIEKHDQLKKSLQSADLKELGSEDSQQVRSETFSRAKLEKETNRAAQARDAAKEDLKVKREVYKKTKKADPTRTSKQIKRQVSSVAKRKGEEALGQENTLAEAVKIRQDSRRRSNTYQTTKYVVGNANRMNMKLTKGAYGLTNKSYNYIRGRGFQRTPEEYSKMRKAAKKLRNFQNRLKASNLGKAAKGTSNFMSSVIKVLNNPLKTKNLVILSGLMMVVATIFMFIPLFTPLPIQQDEFQLTQSWLHMTKVDADRSDETYSFYTPLDEV